MYPGALGSSSPMSRKQNARPFQEQSGKAGKAMNGRRFPSCPLQKCALSLHKVGLGSLEGDQE
jgi:hypothetical protein